MPASYNHCWSIFKAWKDWKAAGLNLADSDICSEDELLRIAHGLGVPAAQLRRVGRESPDPSSLSAAGAFAPDDSPTWLHVRELISCK
jgi:hypothetical protein